MLLVMFTESPNTNGLNRALQHTSTCRHVSSRVTCHVSRVRGEHLLGAGLAVRRWHARTPPPPRADTWLAAVGKSPPVTILSRVTTCHVSRVTPGLLMPLASSRSTSTMLATQNWPPLPSQYCHSSVTQLHCCDAVTTADLARSCSSSAPQRHLVSGLARLPGLCADITSAQLKAASPSHQPRARAVASSPALDRSILVVTLRASH